MCAAENTGGLVLVVDDDPTLRMLVSRGLARDGRVVEAVADGEECLAILARSLPETVILDLAMPGIGGMETLKRLRAHHPYLPVIVLTADREVSTAVEATRLGAFDYLVKPIDRTELLTTVKNALERYSMRVRLAQLEREVEGRGYAGIVGQSPPMKELFRQMDRVAASDISILIHGESGTGKELVARALHRSSGRRDGPFVPLNCAAIPETLQESELFGHERGAFTGATARRVGRFEEADGGTLFLDEVAELSLSAQAKLLRVLQDRSFRRLGASGEVRSDFRLIAATHRDLDEQVKAGRFRGDLYFRVAVLELAIPPLRRRQGDIPLLVERFLQDAADEHGRGEVRVSAEALAALEAYPWPGNVRELENAVRRAAVVCEGGVLAPRDLPARVLEGGERRPANRADEAPQTLEDIERAAILGAIERTGGNLSEVGRQLGIGRTTLYRKLKKYDIR
jgi:DNA-binding NtrC family response regulator